MATTETVATTERERKVSAFVFDCVCVHRGVPLGPQPIEHTRTFDMDGAGGELP